MVTLAKHPSSLLGFSVVRVAQCLVFCVVFFLLHSHNGSKLNVNDFNKDDSVKSEDTKRIN